MLRPLKEGGQEPRPVGFAVLQWSVEEPLVWNAEPPRGRRVPGRRLAITALASGLSASIGVIWIALSWSEIMGEVLQGARWMLVFVQMSMWSITAGLCVWQWSKGRSGLWIAILGGALATLFFWVSILLLVASLPCPSFC